MQGIPKIFPAMIAGIPEIIFVFTCTKLISYFFIIYAIKKDDGKIRIKKSHTTVKKEITPLRQVDLISRRLFFITVIPSFFILSNYGPLWQIITIGLNLFLFIVFSKLYNALPEPPNPEEGSIKIIFMLCYPST